MEAKEEKVDFSDIRLFKQDNGEIVVRKKKKNGMSHAEKMIRNKLNKKNKKKKK